MYQIYVRLISFVFKNCYRGLLKARHFPIFGLGSEAIITEPENGHKLQILTDPDPQLCAYYCQHTGNCSICIQYSLDIIANV